MASSAFSFHCMICFEEFDPQTNYPVVLPCGHTYVCIECANKIDICMECRTPLTIKMEVPPPPPPPPTTPGTPSISSTLSNAAAAASGSSPIIETQKENYADRVRNSPGFRRRYGHREEYNTTSSNNSNNTNNNKRIITRGPNGQTTIIQSSNQGPPIKVPTQRLPLPKNAVLLSLIQASEPARRRAEVEAPPTPVKTEDSSKGTSNLTLGNNNSSETPSPATTTTQQQQQQRRGSSEGLGMNNNNHSLPKFSRPSPLFIDGSSSGERDTFDYSSSNNNNNTNNNNNNLTSQQGSSADDEEHKIRVGTYLEGGPCGTYAVAVKTGLLVYPTLFEHTLPSALNGVLRNSSNNNNDNVEEEEEDVLKRNVDEVMKNYYRESTSKKQLEEKLKKKKEKMMKKQQQQLSSSPSSSKKISSPNNKKKEKNLLNNSEIGSSTTWVECHDNENVEAHFGNSMSIVSPRHSILPMSSCDEEGEEGEEEGDEDTTTCGEEEEEGSSSSVEGGGDDSNHNNRFPSSTMSDPGGNNTIGERIAVMSDPGIPNLPSTNSTHNSAEEIEGVVEGGYNKRDNTSLDHSGFSSTDDNNIIDDNDNDDDDHVGLKLSLSISGNGMNNNDGFVSDDDDDENDSTDNKEFNSNNNNNNGSTTTTVMPRLSLSKDSDSDNNDTIGASVRTLPARRSQSVAQTSGLTTNRSNSSSSSSSKDNGLLHSRNTKKFVRHFSQGSYPPVSNSTLPSKKKKKDCVEGGSGKNEGKKKINTNNDDFERPLIRLKYGDRVQVVSMDSRGWVKLARGYGYIRLENDKQLVKVGGTSDKACQIEAMLHELSIERNRLKHEQTKLERLSAGLMIDLQSALLMSDDNVVVPAPEGMMRSDSELSSAGLNKETGGDRTTSVDDINVSARSNSIITPPRSTDHHVAFNAPSTTGGQQQQREPRPREIRTAKSHSPGRNSSKSYSYGNPPSPPYGQIAPQLQPDYSYVNTPTRVNFRTGLSGHRALTSSHSHPHDFITPNVRSMSNHAGISSSKKATGTSSRGTSSRGRSIY